MQHDPKLESSPEEPLDAGQEVHQGHSISTKAGIVAAWIAFFSVYGVVAPRDNLWSAVGALVGLALLVVVTLKAKGPARNI